MKHIIKLKDYDSTFLLGLIQSHNLSINFNRYINRPKELLLKHIDLFKKDNWRYDIKKGYTLNNSIGLMSSYTNSNDIPIYNPNCIHDICEIIAWHFSGFINNEVTKELEL